MKMKKWTAASMAALLLGTAAPAFAQGGAAATDSCYLFAFFSNNSPYGEQILSLIHI